MRLVLVVAALLSGPVSLEARDEGGAILQLPERPRGHVYDPSGWLNRPETEVLDDRLGALRRDDRIDILVVILTSPPPVRSDVFAKQLLDRWGEEDAQALILNVAGDPESPWLMAGGRMIRLAGEVTAREALMEAKARIEVSGDDRQQILAAVDEMEDLLRFLGYRGRYHDERLRAVTTAHQLGEVQRQLNRRILIITCAFGGGLLVLALCLLLPYWNRNQSPLWFPATSWRLRFGAPYAGGNDAVLRLHDTEQRNSLAERG